MSVGERCRKIRRDKKKDIKPLVDIELKDSVYRLAFITKKSVMKVCELLVLHALHENIGILESLFGHLKRDISLYDQLHAGNVNNKSLYEVTAEENERISFRLKSDDYEILSHLAFGFDCSKAKVAGVLLYESITDQQFIDKYMRNYVERLDKEQKNELKQLLDYIQSETTEQFSFADLLTLLVEEPLKWVFPE